MAWLALASDSNSPNVNSKIVELHVALQLYQDQIEKTG
jgi:hypothetical protein